jgi:hypothetical protein
MPNYTVSKTLHVVLYVASVILTTLLYLASKGSLPITGGAASVLGLLLTTINSIDPTTVIQNATPAQIEVAAKKLPPEALARLVEYQKIKAAEALARLVEYQKIKAV